MEIWQSGGLGAILALAVVYAVRYLPAPVSGRRSLFKTLPVAGMALLAAASGGPGLLVVALGLSALGDYFLSLEDRYFVPGLLAFLGGHLAYILLFLGLATGQGGVVLQGLVLAYALGFGIYLWGRSGPYRWPVLAYIAVIMTMASLALRLAPPYTLATIGAFVFVLSDSLLAVRMFVLGENGRLSGLFSQLVWGTYIVAQLVLLTNMGKFVYN